MKKNDNPKDIYAFLSKVRESASSYYDIRLLVEQEREENSDNFDYINHLDAFLQIVKGSYRISKVMSPIVVDKDLIDEVTQTIFFVLNKKFENR